MRPLLVILACLGFTAPRAAPEGDGKDKDVMVIIGGGFHPKEIEIYHPKTAYQVAGGRDPVSKQRLDSASLVDVRSGSLSALPNTLEQRSGAAAALLYGEVYICGGLEGSKDRRCATEKCEKWNGRSWEYTAHLRQNRAIFAMVTLRGKIYAMGGEVNAGPCDTADAYSVLNTVEAYNPQEKRWDNVAPLINRRYAHAAAVFQDKIWACGGHFDVNYETERMSGCETYDADKNAWSVAPTTARPRAGLALIPMDGVLYAVGGAAIPLANKWFDYDYTPFTLEEYDATENKWVVHKEFLKRRAYGASVNLVARHVASPASAAPASLASTAAKEASGAEPEPAAAAAVLPHLLLLALGAWAAL